MWMQAIRRHEQADALHGVLDRYLELLADRLAAVPTDMIRLPQLYAALGTHIRLLFVVAGALSRQCGVSQSLHVGSCAMRLGCIPYTRGAHPGSSLLLAACVVWMHFVGASRCHAAG